MVKKYNHHVNHGTVPNDKANILGRDFEAETIHQKWCTDITYIHVLKEGWTYLACVMDLYSRKIIGYAYGLSMTAELAVEAVKNACLNVMLGEHFREERSVGFYARQLCITPKYLTTLIKRISGQSVSEWIDNYVILEAKTLLKYSTMSIQEIAYYLNFPNQSFFGSYFKRNTGMSPSQYKAQN